MWNIIMSIPQPINNNLKYNEILPFEDRIKKSKVLLEKYPDKIPVILEKSKKDKLLSNSVKNKLLVSQDMTITTILQLIKKNLKINEHMAIYIMVSDKNIMLSGSYSISEIYNNYKNNDGFLYLEYCSENVFG
jgi:hypothetical protein